METQTQLVARAEPATNKAANLSKGDALGRYLVLEQVGAGGMGVVYRAYDPKLQREVALKIVRSSLLTAAAEGQLVHEARALAKLSHPNVVAVYDVEHLDSGLALAMEYVRGQTLKHWLDRAHRWPEILAMLRQAGAGLHAAHAAGLVHRDFKPSNVLIGEDGRARVVDFGIAREQEHLRTAEHRSRTLDSSDEVEAVATGSGTTTFAGTPAFMSPEQHAGSRATAHADQYAFCLVGWAALFGALPFGGSFRELGKAKQAGPPPRPSRTEVPRVVVEALRRGLAPDPAERWPTMAELLEVLGRDPHRQRRRVWLGLGASTLLLSSGAAVAGWQHHRDELCSGSEAALRPTWNDDTRDAMARAFARLPGERARIGFERAQTALDEFSSGWQRMHRDACEATSVRGEQSLEVLDLRMACLQQARAELSATLEVLVSIDDASLGRIDRVLEGLGELERCDDLEGLKATVRPPTDPEVATEVDALRSESARVAALRRAGRFEAARAIAAATHDRAQALDYPPIKAETKVWYGQVLGDLGQHAPAEALLDDGLAIAIEHRMDSITLHAANSLLFLLGYKTERYEEAYWLGRFALAHARREGHGGIAEAHVLGKLANIDLQRGRFDQAIGLHRKALAIYREVEGDGGPNTARTLTNLAAVLMHHGELAEAERMFRESLGLIEREMGSEHPDVAIVLANLGPLLARRGDLDGAFEVIDRCLRIKRAVYGDLHPTLIEPLLTLGEIEHARGRLDAALAQQERALAIATEVHGSRHPQVADVWVDMALLYLARSEPAKARPAIDRAVEIYISHGKFDHPQYPMALGIQAEMMLEAGDVEAALAQVERVSALESAAKLDPSARARIAFTSARARWALDRDRPAARAEIERLRLEGSGDDRRPDPQLTAAVERWLSEHPS